MTVLPSDVSGPDAAERPVLATLNREFATGDAGAHSLVDLQRYHERRL